LRMSNRISRMNLRIRRDPSSSQEIRRLQRETAMRRMMAKVPTPMSSSPTYHLAVALKMIRRRWPAPVWLPRGQSHCPAIRKSQGNGVTVVEISRWHRYCIDGHIAEAITDNLLPGRCRGSWRMYIDEKQIKHFTEGNSNDGR